MAIKYICDVCGKEHDTREVGLTPAGYQVPTHEIPLGWAAVSVIAPRQKPEVGEFYQYQFPKARIVCSQPCAEKALDKSKKYLRIAFEELEKKDNS